MVERSDITPRFVEALLRQQVPQLADLPLRHVDLAGWDNVTFRLGDELVVRLPSADVYAPQVEKEQRWLPDLAPGLSIAIPELVAAGAPSEQFPWPWSVYKWLPGEPLSIATGVDDAAVVRDLAGFLTELHAVDGSEGPLAGAHSFQRGASLVVYDLETRAAIAALGDRIDQDAALALWSDACATIWKGRPTWLHGDLAPSNLLVVGGRLSAVIDFGCCAVGDPACDMAIAWTYFDHNQRTELRACLEVDAETWNRGRAWALWKGLITAVEIERVGEDPAVRFGWRGSTWDVLERVLSAAGRQFAKVDV